MYIMDDIDDKLGEECGQCVGIIETIDLACG